jgi:hypothetical protein
MEKEVTSTCLDHVGVSNTSLKMDLDERGARSDELGFNLMDRWAALDEDDIHLTTIRIHRLIKRSISHHPRPTWQL